MMSSFRVPEFSSPIAPSTPQSKANRFDLRNETRSLASNPSTTPAGPPPSSAGSFTPADPPPSSIFGSSRLGTGKALFKKGDKIPQSSQSLARSAATSTRSGRFDLSNGHDLLSDDHFALPNSSPFLERSEEAALGHDDSILDGYADGESDADPGHRMDSVNGAHPQRLADSFWSARPAERLDEDLLRLSSLSGSPRGVKRSRRGAEISSALERSILKPRKPKVDLGISQIATSMIHQLGAAELHEKDDLILATEDLINTLDVDTRQTERFPGNRTATLAGTSERLCNLWVSCCNKDASLKEWKNEVLLGLGPHDDAPKANTAVFLSTLLLSLYHPSSAKGKQALAISRFNRSLPSSRDPHASDVPFSPTAYPKILFDWLHNNYDPYKGIVSEVKHFSPSPSAHSKYWDMLFTLAIRGRFAELIQLFETGRFEHASTAKADGYGEGYKNVQLEKVQTVIRAAVDLLKMCPAVSDDDWHVTGNAWIIFRKQVERAIRELAETAEGNDKDLEAPNIAFEASNFGLSTVSNDFSKSSRRAESRIPWSVYQNLKTVYGILLGGSTEILSLSGDWVEATIALTAWWRGEDDEEIAVTSLDMTRRSLRELKSRAPRVVDENARFAYLTRLASCFERVVSGPDDESFQPDTSKPLEVALCAIFERDTKSTVGILRCFSLPIANAVAEVGLRGGWLESPEDDPVLQGFDQDDMDILGLGNDERLVVTRSVIMQEYAEALFGRRELRTQQERLVEGWEIAIAVLARASSTTDDRSKARIRGMLDRLPLNSDKQIDKILQVCKIHEMIQDGEEIVIRYADSILEGSSKYGTALIYYARAHAKEKVKNLLDLLISYSLIQSAAYPAAADLDHNLHALIVAPKEALEHLAILDRAAANILHTYMTGYATLRQFYDSRDHTINPTADAVSSCSPTSDDLAAFSALLAVIESAADSIYGGLHDKSRDSVVQVDGLLTLLGEALVFIDQPPRLLSMSQCVSLLRAIEDLSTTTPKIFAQCEEFLHSTLVAHHGNPSDVPEPRQLLKQMTSSTGSFSLVGSSLLNSQTSRGDEAMDVDMANSDTSRALTKSQKGPNSQTAVQRRWDWRDLVEKDTKGDDLLRRLRLSLAREMAGLWISEGR